MTIKHAAILALLVGASSLAPAAFAGGHAGQGNEGNGSTQASSATTGQANIEAISPQAYGNSGDTVLIPGNGHAAASHARTGSNGNCDDNSGTNGMSAGYSDCSPAHGTDSGGGSSNSTSLGWQSLLPGSIQ